MSSLHHVDGDAAIQASSLQTSDLCRVGDLVQMHSNGLRAWVIALHSDVSPPTCDIRYEIGGDVAHSVNLSLFRSISTVSLSTSRSGQIRNHSIPPSIRPANQPTQPNIPAATLALRLQYANLKSIFKKSYVHANINRHYYNRHIPHPLFDYLCSNINGPKGWIRDIIASTEQDSIIERYDNQAPEKKQLSTKQNRIFLTICSMFSSVTAYGGQYKGWLAATNHAFDVCRKKAQRTFNKYIDNEFIVERKERMDRGMSVFKDEKKRKNTFTAYNAYKRRRCAEYRDSTARIPEATIKNEFDALSPDTRNAYEQLAAADLERSKYLWSELEEFLLKAKGKVSYKTMASYLGNIVCVHTIIAILKEQEGYHTRKDRILPSLDSGKRELRVKWTNTWWLFYLSCAAIPTSVAQIVLLHFDEKWFYAAVARANNKVLTSIGLEPVDYYTRHKSHIHKEMYAAFTAFAPNENDITKGGIPIPVDCVRIGRMLPAKRDSYKRVYKEDGTYHHPQIEANKLRTKGQLYFTSLDLKGSSEGTEKKPKCSLLKIYKERVMAAIEREVVDRFSDNGRKKVIIIKQEDGAGAHNDKKYCNEMKKIFDEKGWILFNQPPQSPITNVHDACIFPMLSKMVSREQATTFGSRLLKGDQLHETVMKVWRDRTNTQALARAFAGHHQIVETIRKCDGDNKFLTEKGGLSFGVRRTYIRNEEGTGVVPITIAPQNDLETRTGQLLNQQQITGLKHAPPKANELSKAELTTEMKDMLLEYMDPTLMSDELHEVWYQLTEPSVSNTASRNTENQMGP